MEYSAPNPSAAAALSQAYFFRHPPLHCFFTAIVIKPSHFEGRLSPRIQDEGV